MFEIFPLAIGLALDTFSAGAVFGCGRKGSFSDILRMAVFFSLAHIIAIGGGTLEMQLNLVAERHLGLPREPGEPIVPDTTTES